MKIRHLVAAAVSAVWLAVPATTLADCQPAGPLEQEVAEAPVVFVGRVVEVRGDAAQIATMEIDEGWKGTGTLGNVVQVRGLGDDLAPSEDDRGWWLGGRYLVVPTLDGNVLRDSICSATTAWTPELAALRPVAATQPASGTDAMLGLIVVVLAMAVAAAAFIGYDRVPQRRPGASED